MPPSTLFLDVVDGAKGKTSVAVLLDKDILKKINSLIFDPKHSVAEIVGLPEGCKIPIQWCSNDAKAWRLASQAWIHDADAGRGGRQKAKAKKKRMLQLADGDLEEDLLPLSSLRDAAAAPNKKSKKKHSVSKKR